MIDLTIFSKASSIVKGLSVESRSLMFWENVEYVEDSGILFPICPTSPFSPNPCVSVDMMFPAHYKQALFERREIGKYTVINTVKDAVIYIPESDPNREDSYSYLNRLGLQRFVRYHKEFRGISVSELIESRSTAFSDSDLNEARFTYLEKWFSSLTNDIYNELLPLFRLALDNGHRVKAFRLHDGSVGYVEYILYNGEYFWVNSFVNTDNRRGNELLLLSILDSACKGSKVFNFGRSTLGAYKELWTKEISINYGLRL